MRLLALILALSCLTAGGCNRKPKVDGSQPSKPEDYGYLPGLKGSTSPKLRDELARILEEEGTPEQLCKTTLADRDNVAAGLRDLFERQEIVSILEKSQKAFPVGYFESGPVRVQQQIDFLRKYDAEHRLAREALKRPKCDFGIQFKAGFMAPLEFVDVVQICARLEAFQAAESLSDDKPDEAIEALRMMLRLASCLGAEKHGQTRAKAAFTRTEAFVVLQAVVQQQKTARRHLDTLYELVESQLKAWPNDADAVLGDRALGMHAYELVRTGETAALLTDEEITLLNKEGGLANFVAAARRNVDRDELYYLETMRQIITSCGQQYFERIDLFDAIRDDLQSKRNLSEFPTIAARLLLPDVQKLQIMQAQDRANWEAWAVGLAAAIGRQELPYQVNPLTGRKYSCKRDSDYIVVGDFGSGAGDDNPTIFVPYLGSEQ